MTRNSKILGIDTTEVSPPYDINNNTSRLAAKLLLYSINSYLGNKNG
ncbi:arginase family protein [Caldisphaera lagunensis]